MKSTLLSIVLSCFVCGVVPQEWNIHMANYEYADEIKKKKKKPSGYNHFMGLEISKMKEDEPSMDHKDRFKLAAGKWKELSEDVKAEWKQKAAESVEE